MKHEKQVWEKSRMELFRGLGCQESGLTQADAKSRLEKYGANELHTGKQKSVLQIFLGQFADFLVLILIFAAVISACMGKAEWRRRLICSRNRYLNTVNQSPQKQNRGPASAATILNEERPLLSRRARPARLPDIQRSFLSGAPDRT